MASPVKVKPVDCVDQSEIQDNIVKNMSLIKEWEGPCKVHDGAAWIMSAGPSLKFATQSMFTKRYFENLPDPEKHKIFCIKHALPVLKDAGIAPFACVALDPRPISGTSTHGFHREGLYASAPKNTFMFIASMTHPSVTEYLLERGYRVIGWHAASGAIEDLVKSQRIPPVFAHAGGTCSAMRCLSVSHNMGFRRANLIGFDSSLEGEPENKDALVEPNVSIDTKDGSVPPPVAKKYIEVYNPKDPDRIVHWTTGELVAQAQDIEKSLTNAHMSDMELRFYATDKGRSYGGSVVEFTKNNTIRPTLSERYGFSKQT